MSLDMKHTFDVHTAKSPKNWTYVEQIYFHKAGLLLSVYVTMSFSKSKNIAKTVFPFRVNLIARMVRMANQ